VRSVPFLAAVAAIGAAAVVSACGQSSVGNTQGTPPATPATVSGACHRAIQATPGRTLMLGNGDNGKAFCVKGGSAVLVILRGTPTRKWTPIHASSRALTPRGNGRLALVLGATGASFLAAHPGIAVISSARPLCATPVPASAAPSSPGVAHCDSELAYSATVIVRP